MYLGRSATAGEVGYWVNALVNHGATQEQALAAFLGSNEYLARTRSLTQAPSTETSFVQTLFQQLLGRNASATEVANFTNTLLPGYGRNGVVWIIVTSAEYRGSAVNSYYASSLNRGASQSELGFWLATGADTLSICIAIEASAESYARS
jgi:hypothetical protein